MRSLRATLPVPGRRLIGLWVALGLLGLVFPTIGWWRGGEPLPGALVILFGLGLLACLGDLALAGRSTGLRARRIVTGPLSRGVSNQVDLTLSGARRRATIQLWDHLPVSFASDAFPAALRVSSGEPAELHYRVSPTLRGAFRLGPLELRIRSPLGLWWWRRQEGLFTDVRVYPNFAPLVRFDRLEVRSRASAFGLRRRRQRGEGTEFEEIRAYRPGDALRQIDWRATARVRRPMSRAYAEERDQPVVFMLDCGRRMRGAESGSAHFDEALAGILLAAHVALRHGDPVGLLTFGHTSGRRGRWLAPAKGARQVHGLLNLLYDLEPTLQMPDYVAAVAELMSRWRKHGLVLLLTDLRGEDAEDLLPAIEGLKARHLVVVVSIRDRALDEVLSGIPDGFEAALRAAGTRQYLEERQRALDALRLRNVPVVDIGIRALPGTLTEAYLALKAARSL